MTSPATEVDAVALEKACIAFLAYHGDPAAEAMDYRREIEVAILAYLSALPAPIVAAKGRIKPEIIKALREWAEFEQDGGNVEQGAAIDIILDWYDAYISALSHSPASSAGAVRDDLVKVTEEMVDAALAAQPRNSPVSYFLNPNRNLTEADVRELMRAALEAALSALSPTPAAAEIEALRAEVERVTKERDALQEKLSHEYAAAAMTFWLATERACDEALDRYKHAARTAEAALTAANALAEEMRKALEPFAAVAVRLSRAHLNNDETDQAYVEIGYLNDADRVLRGNPATYRARLNPAGGEGGANG